MKPRTRRSETQTVCGQPSWRIATKNMEAYITKTGGHLGPVTFEVAGRQIQPYSIAPWAEEKGEAPLHPLLKVLRGDFFCMPFGANATAFQGEKHPPHGETASGNWRFDAMEVSDCQSSLHLSMDTQTRPGRVDKNITLIEGHSAVYCRHVISAMSGPMTLGHHATLRFPDVPGSGRVSTSPFVYGQVIPRPFEQPEQKGYYMLKPGASFISLDKVPTITGEWADLSSYPARRGFEDLVTVVSEKEAPFAWTAVTFPAERYVWFALKNPRILSQTIFWISNGGRHYPPWNGRHVNVMGLEEVTSYFDFGLAESARPNPLTEKGVMTCVSLDPKKPLIIPYVMAVASIPSGFDKVANIEPEPEKDEVWLLSAGGKKAKAIIAWDWLGLD